MRPVSWQDLRKVCLRLGCIDSRQKGDHLIMTRAEDFADFLIVERCRVAGCERVASFDGQLRKAEEAVFQP